MNTYDSLTEIQRLQRNLIRIGTVTAVDLDGGLCRVQAGANETDWLNWLTSSAGRVKHWHAPSEGEQVLILTLGGELDSAFVLPGIFSDDNPAPSASADAIHISFPDGAVIEYEPETGALTATGIQTGKVQAAESVSVTIKVVLVTASKKITTISPEVECTNLLKTATLEIPKGGKMIGGFEHSGGTFSSDGVIINDHDHGGVLCGGRGSYRG